MTLEEAIDLKVNYLTSNIIKFDKPACDKANAITDKIIDSDNDLDELLDDSGSFPFEKFRLAILNHNIIYVELKDGCFAFGRIYIPVGNIYKHFDFENMDVTETWGMTKNEAENCMVIIGRVIIYILYEQKNRKHEVRVSLPKEKKLEHKETNKPTKNHEIYLASNIVEYINVQKPSNPFEYKCDCWGVRGHYRHYKNGKVIFIKAYQKGRNRNADAPPKVYRA